MARGWESKSVEEQIDMANERRAVVSNEPTAEAVDAIRKRQSLLLHRTRVVREMDTAKNQRYRDMMAKVLAELDAQISTLPAA